MTTAIFSSTETVIQSLRPKPRKKNYMPEWSSWSIQEASEKTGYHPEHIRRLIRDGKVEAVKIGTPWLVRVSSLKTYMDSVKDVPQGGPREKDK